MGITVVDHPLVASLLAALRNETTPPPLFRVLAKRLAVVLTVEATRDLPTRTVRIRAPLGVTEGAAIATTVVAVPILRAGLGMLEAVTELLPDVSVGYIGLERDHATFTPSSYYTKLPELTGAHVLLLDPMLATGGSAAAACRALLAGNPDHISLLSIVAAPQGVERLVSEHPDVSIFTAAVDEGLDARAYIRPGLGDFGDRLYGT